MTDSIREKIKPLWILLSNRWGGAERVAMSDIVDMAQASVPVSLLCLKGSPVHAAALRHPHIQVRTFDEGIRKRFDLNFVRALRAIIEELKVNIVHINDEQLLWHLSLALARNSSVSVIASRHTMTEYSIKDWIKAPLLRRLSYIIVLSTTIKASIFNGPPFPISKVKIINLGLDFTRFDPEKVKTQPLRDAWGADTDTVVIGSVGRLVQAVGQDTFLKSAASLMKHKNHKLKFVVVGEDPLIASETYVEELKALVKRFHMDNTVIFETLADNLPELMAAFDIFVMPGREEVPGLGALEALAMERPVVISKLGGAEDIVGNDQYGLLVRPEDSFDLQQKVLYLLENPSKRLTMGKNGRKYVLKNFDKQIRFTRTIGLYEKCLKLVMRGLRS